MKFTCDDKESRIFPDKYDSSRVSDGFFKIVDYFTFSSAKRDKILHLADEFSHFDLENPITHHNDRFIVFISFHLTVWLYQDDTFIPKFIYDSSRVYTSALSYQNSQLVLALSTDTNSEYQTTLKYFSVDSSSLLQVVRFSSIIKNLHFTRDYLLIILSDSLIIFDPRQCTSIIEVKNLSSINSTTPFSICERWVSILDSEASEDNLSINLSLDNSPKNTLSEIFNGLWNITNLEEHDVKQACSCLDNKKPSQNLSAIITHFDLITLIEKIQERNQDLINTKTCIPISLEDFEKSVIMARFKAFNEQPPGTFQYNNDGSLFFVASIDGSSFRIFKINNHPKEHRQTFVHLLYNLSPGSSCSSLKYVNFSNDSRWLTVTSKRGTVHVYAINSYGGQVTARTHNRSKPVNQASSYQISSGNVRQYNTDIEESDNPVINNLQFSSPNSKFNYLENSRLLPKNKTISTKPMHSICPRSDSLIPKTAQMALNFSANQIKGSNHNGQVCHYHNYEEYRKTILDQFGRSLNGLCVAAFFGRDDQQLLLGKKYKNKRQKLYIATIDLHLIEYDLDVSNDVNSLRRKSINPDDKLNMFRDEDLGISLNCVPSQQWIFNEKVKEHEILHEACDENLSESDTEQKERPSPSNQKVTLDDVWLSEIEISTHEERQRKLCLGPQFQFECIDKETINLRNSYEDRDVLASVKSHQHTRLNQTRSTPKHSSSLDQSAAKTSLSGLQSALQSATENIHCESRNNRHSSGEESFQTTSIKIKNLNNGFNPINLSTDNQFVSNSVSSYGDSFSSKSFDDVITHSIAEAMIEEKRKLMTSTTSLHSKSRHSYFPPTKPVGLLDGSSSDLSEMQYSGDGSSLNNYQEGDFFFVNEDEFEEFSLQKPHLNTITEDCKVDKTPRRRARRRKKSEQSSTNDLRPNDFFLV